MSQCYTAEARSILDNIMLRSRSSKASLVDTASQTTRDRDVVPEWGKALQASSEVVAKDLQ
eukprot:11084831-Prorocentrum_lima.AAC.1